MKKPTIRRKEKNANNETVAGTMQGDSLNYAGNETTGSTTAGAAESLDDMVTETLQLLEKAYAAVMSLSAARLNEKLSNTRVAGVGREIKELIKVMSVYKSI